MKNKKKNSFVKSQVTLKRDASETISKKFYLSYIQYIVVFVFAFALYVNTIPNDYSLDDDFVSYKNETVQKGIKGLAEIFSSRYTEKKGATFGYRPITKATLALEYQFFGENPHISHFFNILLYALTGIFLLFLLRKILKKYHNLLPFLITLFFIAHPIHTEVVASIKNREEILSFLGVLGALYFVLKFLERKKYLYILFSIFSFAFAAMSKLSALPFLVVIPMVVFYFIEDKPILFWVAIKTFFNSFNKKISSNIVKNDLPIVNQTKDDIVVKDDNNSETIIIEKNTDSVSKGTKKTNFLGTITKLLENIYHFLFANLFLVLAVVVHVISYFFYFTNGLIGFVIILISIHLYIKKNSVSSAKKLFSSLNFILILSSIVLIQFFSFFNSKDAANSSLRVIIYSLLFGSISVNVLYILRNSIVKSQFLDLISNKKLSKDLLIFLTIFSLISSPFIYYQIIKPSNYFDFVIPILFLLLFLFIQIYFSFKRKESYKNYWQRTKYLLMNIWFLFPFGVFYDNYDIFSSGIMIKTFNINYIDGVNLREIVLLLSVFLTYIIANYISVFKNVASSFKFVIKIITFIFKGLSSISLYLWDAIISIITSKLPKPFLYIYNSISFLFKKTFYSTTIALIFLKNNSKRLYKIIPIAYKRISIVILFIIISLWIIQIATSHYLKKEDAGLYTWQNPLFKENVVAKDTLKLINNPFQPEKELITTYESSFQYKIGFGFRTIGFYLTKLVIPLPFMFYYGYNMIPYSGWNNFDVICSFIICVFLFFLSLYLLPRKSLFSFAILYFFVNISMFANVYKGITGIVGERLIYISSLSICIVVAYLLILLYSTGEKKSSNNTMLIKKFLFYLITISILISSSLIVIDRNKDWKNIKTLFTADINKLKKSAMGNVMYATLMQSEFYETAKQGNNDFSVLELSEKHYKLALKIYPRFHNSWNNLGVIYSDIYKKHKESIYYFKKAAEYKPDYTEAYFNIAFNYQLTGNTDSALYFYHYSLKTDSVFTKTMSYMGNLYFELGNMDSALIWNYRIMKIDDYTDQPYVNIGNYYYNLNNLPEAARYWEIAYSKQPNNFGLCRNLAIYFKNVGNTQKADFYYHKAIEINPNAKI